MSKAPDGFDEFRVPRNLGVLSVATLAQNCATGLSLGSFAVLLPHLQRQFHADAATLAFAVSFMMLIMGLGAPIVGRAISRFGARAVMASGSFVLAVGYLALSVTCSTDVLLALYGLMIGPGMAMLGFIPASAIVTQKFNHGRGLALGVTMAPLGMFLVPVLAAYLVSNFGLAAYFLTAGSFCLAVLVIVLSYRFDHVASDQGDVPPPSSSPTRLPNLVYAISIALGVLVLPGTMALAHLQGILEEGGATANQAIGMIALQGGSGLIGGLVFGYLADRGGPSFALIVNALCQALGWALLTTPLPLFVLVLDVGLLGACGGGVMVCFTALLGRLFPPEGLAAYLGVASLIVVPFTFAAAPGIGLIRTQSGSFTSALLICSAISALTIPMWLSTMRRTGLRASEVNSIC